MKSNSYLYFLPFKLSETNTMKDNALSEVDRLKNELIAKEECLFKRNAEAEEAVVI